MKTIFKQLSLLLLIILTIQSCKKYEDDPFISMRNPSSRIQKNIWDIEELLVDGQDITNTQLFKDSLGEISFTFWEKERNLKGPKCFMHVSRHGGSGTINGLYSFEEDSNTLWIGTGYMDYGKYEEIIWVFGEPFGLGPLGYDKGADWKIHRLSRRHVWLETDYKGSNYFLKLK